MNDVLFPWNKPKVGCGFRRQGFRGVIPARGAARSPRARVEKVREGCSVSRARGIGAGEETIVEAHLGLYGMRRRHPLDRRGLLPRPPRRRSQRIVAGSSSEPDGVLGV